jgi:hypothetical protein
VLATSYLYVENVTSEEEETSIIPSKRKSIIEDCNYKNARSASEIRVAPWVMVNGGAWDIL